MKNSMVIDATTGFVASNKVAKRQSDFAVQQSAVATGSFMRFAAYAMVLATAVIIGLNVLAKLG